MSQPKSLSCVFCEDKFDTKELLRDHFRSHATTQATTHNRFKRSPKVTATKAKETDSGAGIEAATGAKLTLIRCDYCTEQFDTATKAISHNYKKHRDALQRHFCPWCGKLFPIKHIFDIHLESHSHETKPVGTLPCGDCPAQFFAGRARKYHRTSFHRKVFQLQAVHTPPPSKKINVNSHGDVQSVYYCHFCGNEYVIKYNLQKHISEIHGGELKNPPEDILKCTTCDALFYNVKAYEFHITFHRPDDLYVTSEEMRKQVVTKVDQDFDLRRVKPVRDPNTRRINNRAIKSNTKLTKLSLDIGNMANFSPPPSDSESDNEGGEKEIKKELTENPIEIKTENMTENTTKIKTENVTENTTKIKTENTTENTIKIKTEYTTKIKTESITENTTKNTINPITLDQFVNMNKDIFGDPPNLHVNETKMNKTMLDKPAETIKTLPKIDRFSRIISCDKVKALSSLPSSLKEGTIIRKIAVPKGVLKSGIKVLSKDEVQKMQSKGLISLVPSGMKNTLMKVNSMGVPIMNSSFQNFKKPIVKVKETKTVIASADSSTSVDQSCMQNVTVTVVPIEYESENKIVLATNSVKETVEHPVRKKRKTTQVEMQSFSDDVIYDQSKEAEESNEPSEKTRAVQRATKQTTAKNRDEDKCKGKDKMSNVKQTIKATKMIQKNSTTSQRPRGPRSKKSASSTFLDLEEPSRRVLRRNVRVCKFK